MTRYSVILEFPDGEKIYSDEEYGDEGIFDTEAEATEYAYNWMSDYHTGGEILAMSNPGDYEDCDQDVDFSICEIDD